MAETRAGVLNVEWPLTECRDNYKYRYVAYPKLINNDLVWTAIREDCPSDPIPPIAIAFLAIIFIITFVLSSLIVITIAGSFTLKKQLVYHLMANLCIIVMLDCLFNIPFCISYIASPPWSFGQIFCNLSSFAIIALTVEMTFGILLLVIDRLLVAKKNGSYMSLSRTKMRVIIVITWLLSIGVGIPVVMGIINSIPHRNRYSCSVCEPLDIYYFIPHLASLFFAPLFVIISAIIIAIIFYHEQKKHRKVRGNQSLNFFDQVLMTPYYKNEAYTSFCVICLSIIFVLLWSPFYGVITITPYFTDHWDNGTTAVTEKSLNPTFFDGLKTVTVDTSAAMGNASTNGTDLSNYVDEVLHTPGYETAFIWLRFIFDMLVPIFILAIVRDVRQKCRALVFVCRPNTVETLSPKHVSPPYLNTTMKGQTPKDKKKNENMVNFKTPVLFATSEGLHIRTVEDTFRELNDSKSFFKHATDAEPQFIYDLCDVAILGDGGQSNFEDDTNAASEEGDTDYPFEIGQTFNDPVVERAHRNAIGQDVDEVMNRKFSAASISNRPPTPPKRHNSSSSLISSSPPNDMIEIDLERKPKKSGKVVRFNTDLNEEIYRPMTTESDSAIESSVSSEQSTGSGHLADVEEPKSIARRRMNRARLRRRASLPIGGKEIGNPKTKRLNPRSKANRLKKQNANDNHGSVAERIQARERKLKSRHMQ